MGIELISDYKICESFYADTLSSAKEILNSIHQLGELRFDLCNLSLDDISSIKTSTSLPIIFTFRENKSIDVNRFEAYKKAISSRYEYIDLDIKNDFEILEKIHPILENSSTKLIISFHDFSSTPSIIELKGIINKIQDQNPDIIKIVTTTQNKEGLLILEHIQKSNKNIICFGMGTLATESRIKCPINGAPFIYVAQDKGKSTAPGQLNYHDFKNELLKYKEPTELKLAVIGNPIIQSKSPDIFKAFFEEKAIEGNYHKIQLDDASEFLEFREYFDGFNVTAPFKQSLIPYIDQLSEAAKRIGAINTIYRKGEIWFGDNTDYLGIIESINQNAPIPVHNIKTCLIIGAGGAARAAAYAMRKLNIASTILNRTQAKAADLAKLFNHQSIPKEKIQLLDYQLIINTTPLPHELIDFQELNMKHIVLDAIYNQSYFKSEKDKNKVFTFIDGKFWLMNQALASFKLFTEKH